jgi:hypothetical protein
MLNCLVNVVTGNICLMTAALDCERCILFPFLKISGHVKHTKGREALYWMGIGCEILPSTLILLLLVIGNGEKL